MPAPSSRHIEPIEPIAPPPETDAAAENASAAGAGYSAILTVAVNGGLASVAASAPSVTVTDAPNAGNASATGTGYSAASLTVAVNGGLASVAATSFQPTITTTIATIVNAGLASATPTSQDPSKTISFLVTNGTHQLPLQDEAGNPILDEGGSQILSDTYVDAEGSGYQPPVTVKPNAGVAAPTVSAPTAVATAPINAVAAVATATAVAATVNIQPSVVDNSSPLTDEFGTVITDELGNPISILGSIDAIAYNTQPFTPVVSAGTGQATATGRDAFGQPIPTIAVTTAPAVSQQPAVTVLVNTTAGSVVAVGTDAVTATEAVVNVSADVATPTVLATQPSSTVAPNSTAATAAATAPQVSANPRAQAETGAGQAAAQFSSVVVAVAAEAALANAFAYQPDESPVVGIATATATAYDATVTFESVGVLAGVAEANATAYSPTLLGTIKIFVPPTSDDVGPINPDTEVNTHQYRLRGYYRPAPRGRNVWKLPDGTYTEDQPYPLITQEQVNNGEVPINGISTKTFDRVYYGGHAYEVTDEEAAELVAAGFTVT